MQQAQQANLFEEVERLKGELAEAKKKIPVPLDDHAGFTPTKEQFIGRKAFLNYEEVKFSAFAGTGKSTQLRYLSGTHFRHQNGLLVCFNRAIADSAKASFPQNVYSSTSHSIAFAAFSNTNIKNKIRKRIQVDDVIELLGLDGFKLNAVEAAQLIMASIDVFTSSLAEAPDIEHFRETDDLDQGTLDTLASYSNDLWTLMGGVNNNIGISHDGYLKLWQLSKPTLNYDFIMNDEAQDSNPVFLDVIKRQSCSKIYCGDEHQQIYGFRNACNAMEQLDIHECFLTQSFRFGPAVAEIANIILSFKETKSSALLKGSPDIHSTVVKEWNLDGQAYAVIARTNAVLIAYALERINKTQSIHFLSGTNKPLDILEDALALREGRQGDIKTPKLTRYEDWETFQQTLTRQNKDLAYVKKLIETYGSELKSLIQSVRNKMAPVDKAEMILMTAHASKGLQFNNVELCFDFKTPMEIEEQRAELISEDKYTERSETELKEEINLLYVAATRAVKQLKLPKNIHECL